MLSRILTVILISLMGFSGCTHVSTDAANVNDKGTGGSEESNSYVFFNVTTDGAEEAQKLDMAMKLAGFSLDEGREVVLFFNVKGVHVPTASFADDFAFESESPIKEQLASLIDRGADVHVCPICMKALNVEEADLVEGAHVTTRPKLFATIGPNTAVFSY